MHAHLPGDLEARRAPRAALIERRGSTSATRFEDRDRRRHRRERRGTRGTHARETAVVGHDPQLRLLERGIGFDAIDERGAAGRRRKVPLELDGMRAPPEDLLEREMRFRVGKSQNLVGRRSAPCLMRGQQVGRCNHDGARPCCSHSGGV